MEITRKDTPEELLVELVQVIKRLKTDEQKLEVISMMKDELAKK